MNVIVIAPHPDDEILGCGGTIASHCAAGDHVTVVLLTRGNPAIFPADLISRTREEFKQVHNMLGVREQITLDFLAPGLEDVASYVVADQLRRSSKKRVLMWCIRHLGETFMQIIRLPTWRHSWRHALSAVFRSEGCCATKPYQRPSGEMS
jgi:GlcNAc-PI de-N-acetylase